MTLQTDAPIQDMKLQPMVRNARELSRLLVDGELTSDTPYQRDLAWSTDQQVALIMSAKRGVPIPGIIINDRMSAGWNLDHSKDDAVYAVIDGKQRLEAFRAWFNDDIAVPASWFHDEDVLNTEETARGPYVRYSNLSPGEQSDHKFGFTLPVSEAQLPSVEEEAEVYLLVNGSGVEQTDENMKNAARVARGEHR